MGKNKTLQVKENPKKINLEKQILALKNQEF